MELMSIAWMVGNGIVTGGLVRALKGDTFLPYIQPKVRPYAAFGFGAVGGAVESLVLGRPFAEAVTFGLVSAAIAIAGHETGIEGLRGGRELFSKP